MQSYTMGLDKEFHIQVSCEDVGQYVILTNNSSHAKEIASYLSNSKKVGDNCEFVTYTGLIDYMPVSVVSTGVGGPSTAIMMEELIRLGCHTFLKVGRCEGMHLDVKNGDVVVASGAIRDEGTTRTYSPIEVPAVPSYEILGECVNVLKNSTLPYHVGIVHSKDAFYPHHMLDTMPLKDKISKRWDSYCKLDVLATEMETSTVFVVGQTRHVRTGAILQCIANYEREKSGLSVGSDHDLTFLNETSLKIIKQLIQDDQKKESTSN